MVAPPARTSDLTAEETARIEAAYALDSNLRTFSRLNTRDNARLAGLLPIPAVFVDPEVEVALDLEEEQVRPPQRETPSRPPVLNTEPILISDSDREETGTASRSKFDSSVYPLPFSLLFFIFFLILY